MKPYWNEKYGNAGENHKFGRTAKRALDESREKIAKIFDANHKRNNFYIRRDRIKQSGDSWVF